MPAHDQQSSTDRDDAPPLSSLANPSRVRWATRAGASQAETRTT